MACAIKRANASLISLVVFNGMWCGGRHAFGLYQPCAIDRRAIRSDGLNLAGWVANRVDPNQAVFEQNLETLKKRLSAPLLGVVDYSDRPFEQVAEQLRWPE